MRILSYKDSKMCKYILSINVADGTQNKGNMAVDFIEKELQHMCDKYAWEGGHFDSLCCDKRRR
jgi:hypothetical protein